MSKKPRKPKHTPRSPIRWRGEKDTPYKQKSVRKKDTKQGPTIDEWDYKD